MAVLTGIYVIAGEFKGNIYEIQTIEYETKYGSIDTREIDVSYSIWYKLLD